MVNSQPTHLAKTTCTQGSSARIAVAYHYLGFSSSPSRAAARLFKRSFGGTSTDTSILLIETLAWLGPFQLGPKLHLPTIIFFRSVNLVTQATSILPPSAFCLREGPSCEDTVLPSPGHVGRPIFVLFECWRCVGHGETTESPLCQGGSWWRPGVHAQQHHKPFKILVGPLLRPSALPNWAQVVSCVLADQGRLRLYG